MRKRRKEDLKDDLQQRNFKRRNLNYIEIYKETKIIISENARGCGGWNEGNCTKINEGSRANGGGEYLRKERI